MFCVPAGHQAPGTPRESCLMEPLVGWIARVINEGAFIKCPLWYPAKSNLQCHVTGGEEGKGAICFTHCARNIFKTS